MTATASSSPIATIRIPTASPSSTACRKRRIPTPSCGSSLNSPPKISATTNPASTTNCRPASGSCISSISLRAVRAIPRLPTPPHGSRCSSGMPPLISTSNRSRQWHSARTRKGSPSVVRPSRVGLTACGAARTCRTGGPSKPVWARVRCWNLSRRRTSGNRNAFGEMSIRKAVSEGNQTATEMPRIRR